MESKKIIFEVSAPGKIILFGEHSVVYQKTAIAASLNLRTKLTFTETDDNRIHLQFSKVNVDETFDMSKLKFEQDGGNTRQIADIVHEKMDGTQRVALLTFFKVFSCLSEKAVQECRGFRMFVDTELDVGSGVGSSASFSVVVSSALLIYDILKVYQEQSRIFTRIFKDGVEDYKLNKSFEEKVLENAYLCEQVIHGTPSGIDHTTSLLGSMIQFKKGAENNEVKVLPCSQLKVLLVNTNIKRSTKVLVQNVRTLKERFGDVMDHVLEAMNCIACRAVGVIQELSQCKDSVRAVELETRLGELVRLNHNLLKTIGVSHDSLERIVRVAEQHGLAAKLTGAGGGGYAFVLIPTGTDDTCITNIKQMLTDTGYHVTQTELGGAGLQIHLLHH